MAEKYDVLRESRKNIAERGAIRGSYFEDGCYCAVGYVLKELGLTDDELESLRGIMIGPIYSEGSDPNTPAAIARKVYNVIEESETNPVLLHRIQIANDEGNCQHVLEIFDEALAREHY